MSQIFEVIGYCPCVQCCGKNEGLNVHGRSPQANHTIAAPHKYPIGTRIVLDGYGTFYVEFVGGSVRGNRIERFFNTQQEVLNWGIKRCKGTVYM